MVIQARKVQGKDKWYFDYGGFRILIREDKGMFKANVFSKKYKSWKASGQSLEGVADVCIRAINGEC